MNLVLEEIIRTGCTETSSGRQVPVSSAVPPEEGTFLQSLIRECQPSITLEIGLAQGISALFICDALEKRPETRCLIIDPHQFKGNDWGGSWEGIGWNNLQKAGFADLVEFYEIPSHLALAKIEKDGRRVDFAFIDGWHTFDHTIVEFFMIDKILKVGGIIVFDDADWPAVRKVCRYIVTNRSYTVFRCMKSEPAPSHRRSAFKGFARWLHRIKAWETDHLFGTPATNANMEFSGRCVALKKQMEDMRRWDFHRPF